MPSLTPAAALWAARVLWVATAVTGGLALEGRPVALVGWWLAAAVIVLALVVPGCTGLTLTRMIAPAMVPAMVLASIDDTHRSPAVWATALALAGSVIVATGEFGQAMVQASAYGDERRFPLRLPAAVIPPMAISWSGWAALTVTAISAADDGRWLLVAATGLPAVALSWPLFARLHQLSRRWFVIVPAGVVVHDPLVLAETFMALTPTVGDARLAPHDTEAADLTGPASGYAVEVTLTEMALVQLAPERRGAKGRAIHARAFLVAPSRPGRVVQAITAHRH